VTREDRLTPLATQQVAQTTIANVAPLRSSIPGLIRSKCGKESAFGVKSAAYCQAEGLTCRVMPRQFGLLSIGEGFGADAIASTRPSFHAGGLLHSRYQSGNLLNELEQ
jgi:hypothetical protein